MVIDRVATVPPCELRRVNVNTAGELLGLTVATPVFKAVAVFTLTTTSVNVTSRLATTLAWEKMAPACWPNISVTLRPSPVLVRGVMTAYPVWSVVFVTALGVSVAWAKEREQIRSPTTNEYKRSFITPSSIQAARGTPSFMIEIVELTPESAERLNDLVEQLRIKKIKRHIFLCADQTKPKC